MVEKVVVKRVRAFWEWGGVLFGMLTISMLVLERVTAITMAIEARSQGIVREIIQRGSIEAGLRATGLEPTTLSVLPRRRAVPSAFFSACTREISLPLLMHAP